MKKLITFLLILLTVGTTSSSFAQFFQGGWSNIGNKLSFKMKPTGDITTQIAYIEMAFRYNVASTPAFTVNNITNNTANFTGSLNMQRLADYNDGTYNYIKFVHNTGVIASKTYTSGVEYEIFTVTLDGSPSTATLELASDLSDGNYIFGVADGAGNQIDPGAGDQLYGTGSFKTATGMFVPLTNVPLPVKFLGFDVTKKNNSAVLNWTVENESAITDKYIIESSANSVDFTTVVGTISALNNGRTSNTYSFTQDNVSAVRASGVVYYRIKQIDKDGKFVYTPIRNLRLDGKGFAVNAYPNPVKSSTKLTIDLLDDSRILVSITDATGKQVKSLQMQGFKGPNIKEINLNSLASGNYLLKVQAGTEVRSVPLVKAN